MNTDTHDKSIRLYGMLNPLRHPECCVCGWHGAFERAPSVLRERMRTPSGRKAAAPSRAMSGHRPTQQAIPHRQVRPKFVALWWRTALAAARKTFGRSG